MQTVLSKTGIEVCYPCIVHLLRTGENFECEYKSDHTGRDLVNYICKIQKIRDTSIWGMKFTDTGHMDEIRYWLDLDKLIRSQVKNICPIRFYFRVKVYPQEPYKIDDQAVKFPIFQQLRLDLLSGRLFCDVNDASMLAALILQHVHGNFAKNIEWMYLKYFKEKILRRERCSNPFFVTTQKRAMEIYEKLLINLSKLEVEDMFLRLASKLESYGVEPFLVQNLDRQEIILWMNHIGVSIYSKKKRTHRIRWKNISKITHEYKGLYIHYLNNRGVLVIECLNVSECNYIWSLAMDHLLYFTSPVYSNACVGEDTNMYFDGEDKLSNITSFFGSCNTEYKYSGVDEELLNDTKPPFSLKLSESLRNLVDLNSWKSQLSVMYGVLLLFLMGSNITIFSELPSMGSIRECINNYLAKPLFNKMLKF